MAIVSFNCAETQTLFVTGQSRRFMNILGAARRKLLQLDAAESLLSLKLPPGNRLEKLSGDLQGRWSIRINDQWRVCFVWTSEGAQEVEIVDYH